MRTLQTILVLILSVASVSLLAQSKKEARLMEDAKKAKQVLLKVDSSLEDFFDESAGYIIFPNVGKGGFIIGGASGNGIVYHDGEAVGRADLKKLNIGLQAGGQAIIEAVFFETEQAFTTFKNDSFSFSAEASAVAVKSGIAANAKYRQGVAVFAMPKAGLMADASVGGQRFSYEPFTHNNM